MPLRLDIKRKLSCRSDRVKSVDLHPTESWMLASLYNGQVHIWNYESQTMVKTFEVCDLPVRTSKFVPRKSWVITGSDDMQIRAFNYNTLERVHNFEAHSDYVRCLAVHPTQPFLLSSSDDMTIKLWDWDKKWQCAQTFEGHTHYVMQIVINPKDNNTFASASLDRTIKIWQLGSSQPNYTLEGHEKGVNTIDYYYGGEKPYLVSGADDKLVKIWDYQNKNCVQTLTGHAQNISAVAFHPDLPIILTGSEDGTVRVWHANTYRLETTLNYGLERVWAINCLKGSNSIAIGYDEGSVVLKLGREEPAVSMDNSGKIVWAKHSEIQQANLKTVGDAEIKDGERLPLTVKDMGGCEIYPQTIAHSPNGRFVVVCGDGEFIIYTAMALRNKSFGPAQEFVWSQDSSGYAIRESSVSLKLFKNFKETKSFKPDYGADGIFGGTLLGVKAANSLAFYDWESNQMIRRIEIQAKGVYWAENGEHIAIATDDSYFVLKYDAKAVAAFLQRGDAVPEDGVEEAFSVVGDVQETIKTGFWIGDCFIYTNTVNRLNYYVGGEIVTIAHLDRTMYLIGYIPKENRIYLVDKDLNVVSYLCLLSVLEYQTAVMRRDFATADRVLPTVPKEQRTRVAQFLEKQGFKSQALAVTTDPEHKFELALQLKDLKTVYDLAKESESIHKWKQLGAIALKSADLHLAEECMIHAEDYTGLLLLAQCSGNLELMKRLASMADEKQQYNIAFTSYWSLGKLENCLEILIKSDRLPEAAFFAKTYVPSHINRVLAIWKEKMGRKNAKAAQALADPIQYPNLFGNFEDGLKAEQFYTRERQNLVPANRYNSLPKVDERNLVDEMQKAAESGRFVYDPDAAPAKADNVETLTEGTKSEDGTYSSHDHEEKFETPSLRRPVETETMVRHASPVQNPTRATVNGGDNYDINQLETELEELDFTHNAENHIELDEDDQSLI
ncbi:coatomer subunit beta'-like [Paramacrobiotus metropolitanus]|uniref:coatomer subunit beta'-like n=1 Tax=Paramacrobiotus metropolitanus TaxID=2943436 RepID=UPI002445B0ED|nr:coatomer subunit beta'-like [Paramacrobiotus metropolitanus]